MFMIVVNECQDITIPGDLLLITSFEFGALIHNLTEALVRCAYAFDAVRCLRRLHYRNITQGLENDR